MEIGKQWIELSWGGMTMQEKVARLENNVEYLKGVVPDGLKETLTDIEAKLSTLSLEIEGVNTLIDDLTKQLEDIKKQIGDLSNLTTTAKDNIVNAINEVSSKTGGKIEEVKETDEVLWIEIKHNTGGETIYSKTFYKSQGDFFISLPRCESDGTHITFVNYEYDIIEKIFMQYDTILKTNPAEISTNNTDMTHTITDIIYYGYKKA